MKIDDALEAFRDGRITATEFFRSTSPVWERIAKYLLRRWRAPSWVDVEEIVQELYIGATQSVWQYSEHLARGTTLAQYVEWNAIDYAKKKLHAMRGAKRSGNADRNPSRFELPFSSFQTTDEWLEGMLRTGDTPQMSECSIREAIEGSCTTERERCALESFLSCGDIVEGAAALFDDERMRRRCGIAYPREAGRLVAQTVINLAERLAAD